MDDSLPKQHQVPELLGLLLGQANEHALILLDAQARIVGWFAGSERILGYRADEVIGWTADFLFTPEDQERGIPQLEVEIARSDGQAEDDRWHVRKDGGRIWSSGTLVALRSEEGQIVGFGKILRNRTDARAQIEALENKVEALSRTNRQQLNFVGMLAHELRNPLASLVGSAEVLQTSAGESADIGFAAKLIRRQAEFIQRLVDDLLDVTRIGVGKVDLQRTDMDLAVLLRNVAESMSPQMQQRQLDFHVLLPPSPIKLTADGARLHQVFTNLLSNAIKFTEPGGSIWLKTTVEGSEAVVRVQDTGVGISAEVLPQIFDLFTQEEASRSRSAGGLGIGLSLVKEFVTLHGGTVTVRSDGKQKGSEFTVRLPLSAGEVHPSVDGPTSPT